MFVVYHQESLRIKTSCKTAGSASSSCTKQNNKLIRAGRPAAYGWTSQQDYDTNLNTMTTTYNMLDPERRPIPIRKADLGGCCDPATETYHSM